MMGNKSVNAHSFAMIPKTDIPRASFLMEHVHKTSFDASYLIPLYVDEMLPGDTFNMRCKMVGRLATPLVPVMDNLHLDWQFWGCPLRLLWTNFVRMMGEQPSPGSSISFTTPQIVSPVGGYAVGSIYDYFGLPTVGQMGGAATFSHSALPLRMYNLTYDRWYRDQNLQDTFLPLFTDGPDPSTDYALQRRGKRHDYFTSCLPFTQKGTAVSFPLAGSAPVVSISGPGGANGGPTFQSPAGLDFGPLVLDASGHVTSALTAADLDMQWLLPNLEANLSAATGPTVNAVRLALATQKFLEKNARGGTRYIETIQTHFNVRSPDFRMQRPEYLGGGSTPIQISPVAQTSATSASGTDTPQGNLAAIGTVVGSGGFTYSATEHMLVMCLASVRADLTYQQGVRRFWNRLTVLDHYWPSFAQLGEQPVYNREIYADGSANDLLVFGYQERWAEYRYFPSMITSLQRSTAAANIDEWHYAQDFATLPTLNSTFIADGTREVLERTTAVGAAAYGQQIICDAFFSCKAARPIPAYSVPGLGDRF